MVTSMSANGQASSCVQITSPSRGCLNSIHACTFIQEAHLDIHVHSHACILQNTMHNNMQWLWLVVDGLDRNKRIYQPKSFKMCDYFKIHSPSIYVKSIYDENKVIKKRVKMCGRNYWIEWHSSKNEWQICKMCDNEWMSDRPTVQAVCGSWQVWDFFGFIACSSHSQSPLC